MASYPGSGKRPSRAPHNKFVGGEFALAISDRSGLAFPYNEMKFEWTGMFVHDSEWEPKQPQLSLTYFTNATALKMQDLKLIFLIREEYLISLNLFFLQQFLHNIMDLV